MSTAVPAELTEDQRRSMLLRAVIASTIGTSIEWYDFFLYSIVTGLVFAKQFFPNQDLWQSRVHCCLAPIRSAGRLLSS